ncbi:prepilin peptidase [Rubrobacter aplysinae]|uniref:prepilin peptidase n=1 Tax=Rubrobacter aplysinae TaxID=909625 RepID=UPI00064B8F83|nr:A24 family peptidase [Rubrobacter aplysinae]
MLLALVLLPFGLVIGSFLNVVIHRVPRKESVAWPASHCPGCGAALRKLDNIPLLSYVVLRGRCRECGAGISPRYPLVELATAVLFAAAAYLLGPSVELATALILVCALVALAVTDLEHQLLPNVIVVPALLAGLVLSAVANPAGWWTYPVVAAGMGGFLLALALVYPGGMGMGDVKMGAMLGAFLGGYAALAVFLAALAGAVVSGVLMATGRAGRRTRILFGFFMALGGLATLFAGPGLWGGYLRLLGGG